jgi:hypothetical protein
VRVPPRLKLAEVFCLETLRVVANDWVVRYQNRLFQLERRSPLPPARSTVLIYEDDAGRITIRYRGALMPYTELKGPRVTPAPPRAVATASAPAPSAPSTRSSVPCADHPWRRKSEHGRYARALGLARQAWRATAVPADADLADEGTFLSS